GYFIYQSTLRVPLLIHWPAGSAPAPARVDTPVSLLGVAPTILQALEIPAPPGFQGKSLTTLWTRKAADEEIYSESLYAHRHFQTSSLRSLRVGTYKYIQAPKPELYDLAKDPGEARNLVVAQPDLARTYHKRLNVLRARYAARKAAPAPVSPQVAQSLRSLGYLAGPSGTAVSEDKGPDPKDRIADYADYRRAITLESLGQLSKSNELLEGVLARQPDQAEVRSLLALNLQRLGNHTAAVKNFRQVLEKNPMNASAHFSLAISCAKLNQLDEVVQDLQVALHLTSQAGRAQDLVAIPAEEALGGLWIRKNEWEKARAQFTHLLTIAPENYEAHYNLAWLAGRAGRLDEAIGHLRKAIQADPKNAAAHNALGSIYLQQKNWELAGAEFRTAVRLDPKLGFAHYNLGLVLGQQGDRQGAAQAFREALKADPQLEPARAALSRMGL
ncbi:MAG TPA: tetratricopeptide repeat protein, partial [Bryobacteraceae bacterium]|nr:tetratricopeptide repeat protein [Bryobacteraceae bacterium]